MSGRALAISQKQVTALCKGAAKAGFVAEVKIGAVVVRLMPAGSPQSEPVIDDGGEPPSFNTLDEYRAWRQRSRAGGD